MEPGQVEDTRSARARELGGIHSEHAWAGDVGAARNAVDAVQGRGVRYVATAQRLSTKDRPVMHEHIRQGCRVLSIGWYPQRAREGFERDGAEAATIELVEIEKVLHPKMLARLIGSEHCCIAAGCGSTSTRSSAMARATAFSKPMRRLLNRPPTSYYER